MCLISLLIVSYLIQTDESLKKNENTNELKLTEKEVEIITFLNSKNSEQSILKLQEKVWGYSSELETHTVETHIYRLRKKIYDCFNDNNFIVSYNNGYKIQKLI